jgi:chromosomal replication initiation ATPase DnaA
MYLTHVVYGRSLAEVGAAFGRDRTTVSYACGLIEDQRDDPHFDREVDRLEAILTEGEDA